MLKSKARYETSHGSKYLQQLCKHFAHKIEATYTETEGQLAFEMGSARLRADDGGLEIVVTGADEEAIARLHNVIDRHLERFAFRESFTRMPWQAAEAV